VTFVVVDERNLAGFDLITITVMPPANTLPVASPTATPAPGDTVEDQPLRVDASNGVQVELYIGSAAAVETTPMTMTRKNTLGYQKP